MLGQQQENITRDESGVYIQPSRRPDGSLRKAIRVKAGYVPQDEVPLYESKGKQFASRQATMTLPVGLDPSHAKKLLNPQNPIPGLVILEADVKKKKKKKKPEDSPSGNNTNSKQTPKSQSGAKKPAAPSKQDTSNLSSEELEKRIKNLKKKVREINTLEGKIESGEIKNPEKDQLEKLQRKPDLLSEIMALKLSLHGDSAEPEDND